MMKTRSSSSKGQSSTVHSPQNSEMTRMKTRSSAPLFDQSPSSSCSNCLRRLPRTSSLMTVNVKSSNPDPMRMSIGEALHYIFRAKGQAAGTGMMRREDLCLCVACGPIFQSLVDTFVAFTEESKSGSVIHDFLQGGEEDGLVVPVFVKMEENSDPEYPDSVGDELETEEPDQSPEVASKGAWREPEVNEEEGDNSEKELWEKRRKLVHQIRIRDSRQIQESQPSQSIPRLRSRKSKHVVRAEVKDDSENRSISHVEPSTSKSRVKGGKRIKNNEENIISVESSHDHEKGRDERNFETGNGNESGTESSDAGSLGAGSDDDFNPDDEKDVEEVRLSSSESEEDLEKDRAGKTKSKKSTRPQVASGAQQGHKSGDKTSSSKLRPHKCDTCSKGFPNKTKLRAHRITHIPKNEREKPFECPVCSKRFSLQSALQKHRKIVHKETRDPSSKCHLCERNFLRKSQLRYHLISAHNFNHTQATAKAYIQTNKTKKELPIVPALHGAEDSASAPGEPPEDFKPGTSCPICFKPHTRRWGLISHMIRIHRKSNVEARTMTRIDGEEPNPVAESASKPRRPTTKAEDADRKYYTGADGTVALKCDTCDESLGSLREWATHQMSEHEVKVGDWLQQRLGSGIPRVRYLPCPVCWKHFALASLPGHIAVNHTKIFPFVCTQCGKGYAVKASLTSHMQREHEGIRPLPKCFFCLLCGSAFLTKGGLLYHERRHRDEVKLSHICEKCGKGFCKRSNLQTHVLSHVPKEERPRPFACSLCTLTFTCSADLVRHGLVHTGPPPDVKCELCEKTYLQKVSLKDHLISVHQLSYEEARRSAKLKRHRVIPVMKEGEEIRTPANWTPKPTTTCRLCLKTFTQRKYLATHLIGVHGKTEEEAKAITGLESKRTLALPANSSPA